MVIAPKSLNKQNKKGQLSKMNADLFYFKEKLFQNIMVTSRSPLLSF